MKAQVLLAHPPFDASARLMCQCRHLDNVIDPAIEVAFWRRGPPCGYHVDIVPERPDSLDGNDR